MSSISIKSILREHSEWILIGCGLLLVFLIGWMISWGVTILAQNLGSSLATPRPGQAGEKFELEKAAQLDFRGLN